VSMEGLGELLLRCRRQLRVVGHHKTSIIVSFMLGFFQNVS
jgi:hypothetical protein